MSSIDVKYLEAIAVIGKQVKERSYDHLQLQPGQSVLDVGCGPGIDTVAMSHFVGATGQVCGLDVDQTMLATANERARQANVQGWVHHHHGDAYTLPFDQNLFDACRSERLFQHLREPANALAEMKRVIKPDGHIVVIDTDWGTLSVDAPAVALERYLARVQAEQRLTNGYAGRQLYRLFHQHDLHNLVIENFVLHTASYMTFALATGFDELLQIALAMKAIDAEELNDFHAQLIENSNLGGFYASVNLTLMAGQK